MLCLNKQKQTAGIFAELNLVFSTQTLLLHNLQSLYWAEAQNRSSRLSFFAVLFCSCFDQSSSFLLEVFKEDVV